MYFSLENGGKIYSCFLLCYLISADKFYLYFLNPSDLSVCSVYTKTGREGDEGKRKKFFLGGGGGNV